MPSIAISQETFARLQAHAEPFVDTPESVINRGLEALERSQGAVTEQGPTAAVLYDPAAPPNLTHTKVLAMRLAGEMVIPSEAYWNHLMFALVRKAAATGRTPKEILAITPVNSVAGKKEDNGFRFVAEANISVQGQDAMGAWKAIHRLATALKVSVDVTFAWYQNPKATHPGTRGRMIVDA